MTHVDESALMPACAYAGANEDILRSCIVRINERYIEMKRCGNCPKGAFHNLWVSTIREDQRIDLLTFQIYKDALGKYYSLRRQRKTTITSFKMSVESSSSTAARVRVSEGVSMVFFATTMSTGKLSLGNIGHRHNVLHTGKKDIREADVMQEAKKLALRAMNAKRLAPRKRKVA